MKVPTVVTLILVALSYGVVVEAGLLKKWFSGTTSTTTEEPETTTPARASLFINNNVPKAPPGCVNHFDCKKKMKVTASPKPCQRWCLNKVVCEGGVATRAPPDQCVEISEEYITSELNRGVEEPGTVPIMMVAMIDFPCQPGFLPDSRGRCREIW